MTQSRTELINTVGRILAGRDLWDAPQYRSAFDSDYEYLKGRAEEIVTALRPEAKTRDCDHRQCPPDKCQGC